MSTSMAAYGEPDEDSPLSLVAPRGSSAQTDPTELQKSLAIFNPTLAEETEAVTGVKPRDVSDFRANTSFIENYLMSVDPNIQQAFFKPGSSDRYTGTFAQAYKLVDGNPVEVEATPEDIASGDLIYYVGGAPGSDYAGQSRVGQAYALKDGKLTPIGEAKPYEAPEEKNFWMEGLKDAAALALAAYLGPGGGLESLLGSGATGTGGLAALGEGAGAAGTAGSAGSITSALTSALPADLVSAGQNLIQGFNQVRPYLQGANAVYQASQGNIAGAVASGLGAAGGLNIPGAKEAANLFNVGYAASQGNYLPVLNQILSSDVGGQLTNTKIAGDFTLGDAMKAGNFLQAVQSGNPTLILSSAATLTGSNDLKTASAANKLIQTINNPNASPFDIAFATEGLAKNLMTTTQGALPGGSSGKSVLDEYNVTGGEGTQLTPEGTGPLDYVVGAETDPNLVKTGVTFGGTDTSGYKIPGLSVGDTDKIYGSTYLSEDPEGGAPYLNQRIQMLDRAGNPILDASGNQVFYTAIYDPTDGTIRYSVPVGTEGQYGSNIISQRPQLITDDEGNQLLINPVNSRVLATLSEAPSALGESKDLSSTSSYLDDVTFSALEDLRSRADAGQEVLQQDVLDLEAQVFQDAKNAGATDEEALEAAAAATSGLKNKTEAENLTGDLDSTELASTENVKTDGKDSVSDQDSVKADDKSQVTGDSVKSGEKPGVTNGTTSEDGDTISGGTIGGGSVTGGTEKDGDSVDSGSSVEGGTSVDGGSSVEGGDSIGAGSVDGGTSIGGGDSVGDSVNVGESVSGGGDDSIGGCPEGYELGPDGKTCVLIKPKEPEVITCPTGYHLGPDGKTCVPDEKEEEIKCPEGYHLGPDGKTCVLDEKEPEEKTCPEGYYLGPDGKTCIKYEDDEEITCPPGYHLGPDGKTCVADEAKPTPVTKTPVSPTTPTTPTPTRTVSAPSMAAAWTGAEIPRLIGKMLKAKVIDQKQIDPLAAFKQRIADMNAIDPSLAQVMAQRLGIQQQEMPSFSYGQETSIDDILNLGNREYAEGGYVEPLKAMNPQFMYREGGSLPGGRENFKDGKHVAGEGDGQSDDIPAWLADGEFVFPADVVSALGNGSTKAGTDKLYKMMHEIRARARSTHKKDLPPPAHKSPLDYLKGK